MSGLGLAFTDAPQREVGASEAKVGAASPARTNSALQLAGALNELNPKLAAVAGAISREDQSVQAQAAKKLAIQNGGAELSQAVRDGKIEATQNPFFIQDYNRESSYIRAQNEIAQIRIDAQTWPEQNDPVAFQQRYVKALAEIGQNYNDPDSGEGFAAAAGPAMQQDFAANTAQKVAQIKADRISAMSNLVAQQVGVVQSATGGKPAPSQVWEAITPLKEQYLSTGGTPQEWDKLVQNGITAAALQQQNPTLMDLLKDSGSGTNGAIYNIPGAAQDIETTKYRITQDQQEKGRQAYYDAQQADYFAGRNAEQLLYKKYGVSAFTGNVTPDDMVKTLQQGGVPVAGITGALNKAQVSTADYQGLAESKFKAYSGTKDGQAEILDLHMMARTQGYTPELETRLSEHVLKQDIPASTANEIIGQALETNRAATGGRLPAGVKKALQAYSSTGSLVDQSVASTASRLNQVLQKAGASPLASAEIGSVRSVARNLANYYLQANPGDYAGAAAEAQRGIEELFRKELTKRMAKSKAPKK